MQVTYRYIQLWRASVVIICAASLTGCSIKNDVPDFKYPSRTNFTDQNWPELVVTEELLAVGENTKQSATKAQLETDRLAARAARLRARARALRNAP